MKWIDYRDISGGIIMKLRRCILFVLTLVLLSTVAFAAEYPDVTEDHWAHMQIAYLSDEITGYPDGTYRPEKTVSRAEFLSLFVRLAYPEELQGRSSDLWWEPAYDICIEKNLISSDHKNPADMNAAMPRGEIAQLLGRYCSGWGGVNGQADAATQFSINWEEKRLEAPEYPTLFSDVPSDLQSRLRYAEQGFAYDWLLSCVNQGLMTGYPDGTFQPDKAITRAEAAVVLSRLKAQLALREDGMTYLCTVGQYWLAQWESDDAVGLSLYDPLTGTPHETVCFRLKKDTPDFTLQDGTRLLTGSDAELVWGLFGLYRKNGDTLDILYSAPVLDYCMDGETMYYLTCDFSEPAYYSGAGVSFLCADTVCKMTQEGKTTAHLVLASCETMKNGLRKPDQNLTDIYYENGTLYVAGSYYMGMTDLHGALYAVKNQELTPLFGQY